jgi:hypothetical protein
LRGDPDPRHSPPGHHHLRRDPPSGPGLFEPGQRVLFGILSGTALAAEGATSEEEYRLLPAGEVLCTVPATPGDLIAPLGTEGWIDPDMAWG